MSKQVIYGVRLLLCLASSFWNMNVAGVSRLRSGQCWEESEEGGQKVRAKVKDSGRPQGNEVKVVRNL